MPILAMLLFMAVPIIAIIGGIVSGIMKTAGRQRLLELAQRERIAAIERGIDVSKLPPLQTLADDNESAVYGYGQALKRSHSLLIGGLITLAVGAGLGTVAGTLEPDKHVWVVGLVPAAIGFALLLSAWLVRPRPENGAGR